MLTEERRARIRRSRPELLALGAMLVTVVLWASAFVAIRYVGRELSGGPLALGRLVVGSAVLGAVLIVREGRRAPDRAPATIAWPRLVLCGLAWFGVYNVALNEAERRIDAGTAAMLVGIGPILLAILAGILLGEGFPARLIAGSVVGFAGVVVIGWTSSPAGDTDVWGVALCVVAAAGYAVGVVAQKPLLRTASALRVTWLACLVGAIGCLPYLPTLLDELADARPATVGWLLYLGVMPTALAFTTWAYALARSTAGKLGATTYLVPPIAVLMGWALLGETPAVAAIGGGLLCLAGVYVSRRGLRRG